MKGIQSSLILSLLLFLNACTTTKEFVSLPESLRQNIKSSEVYVTKCQDGLDGEIEQSNVATYAGGGLLFALVDSVVEDYRTKRSRGLIKPIQDEIKEVHVEKMLHEKLVPVFKNIKWIGCQKVHFIEQKQTSTHSPQLVEKSDQDSVLFVTMKYDFNPDFDTFTGKLLVEMYPSSSNICSCLKSKEPKKEIIYKAKFMVSETLPNPTGDLRKNAELWAKENGIFIKNAIHKIVNGTVQQLEKDLKSYN